MKTTQEIEQFVSSYIQAALWSYVDDGDEPLDLNYDKDDLAPETLASMRLDCKAFIDVNGIPKYNDAQYTDAEKAGHDFWLTRCGHGAGFWDRAELSKQDQDRLTEASNGFGNIDLYVSDDKICVM